MTHHDVLKGRVASAEAAIGEVDPVRDQDLFIEHNIRPFVTPGDWTFEPCASHYDLVCMSRVEP
jgi:formin-binding protein 1